MMPLLSAIHDHPSCLAFDDGEKRIEYGELPSLLANSPLNQLTNISTGDLIAWVPSNNVDSFLTFWGLQKRGCIACPINSRYSELVRNQMVEQIGAKWLPDLFSQNSSSFGDSVNLASPIANAPSTLIFSSGSMGQPKAIVHAMSAHVASASGAAKNIPLDPGGRWLWSLPLCHISGLSILIRCAVAGATVVGMQDNKPLNASLLRRQEVTHLSVVSTQLQRLLAEEEFPSPHLRSVLLGGSAVNPNLIQAARDRGIDVRTTYGLTELASQVTTSTANGDANASGRLLPHRQMEISVTGEILVRGKTLCMGYLRDGTIESVVDENGWFHTKDLGNLNEQSELVVKGRIDNMFVSGGENIHPENIERAMRNIFNLTQVLVVPQQDEEFGARPVAFVQGQLPPDWKERLGALLPRYELPIAILEWPAETGNAIKPSRSHFQSLLANQ